MEQTNKLITLFLVLILAIGLSLFLFYRLGLLTRFFPNNRLSLGSIFASKTTPTPTPNTVAENTDTSVSNETTQILGQTTQTVAQGTNTQPTPMNIPSQIPSTGAPTLLIPLAMVVGVVGRKLQKTN